MGVRLLFWQLISLLMPSLALAYPNFVGFGYQSCLTCHYNPLGNGPLTDYGRGVGATVISDRLIYSDSTTDDQLGVESGFLYRKPSIQWLRPSLNYRGLYLKSGLGTSNEKSEFIHMMANFNLVLRLGPKDNKDKFIMVGTFGYAPTPRAHKESTEANWRTREHYIGYRITPAWGLYAGLMDKAFGIRLPDHTAFSRSSTSNTMNDQTHGLLIHYYRPTFEIALHGFAGNLEQKSSIRQVGGSLRAEYSLSKKSRIGASVMKSESDFLKMYSHAIHSKIQYGKGSSTMLEVGETTRDAFLRDSKTKSRYVMMQNHLRLRRGLQALVTGEYFRADTSLGNKILRLGPGFQFFPFQGLELRMDFYNSRIFSETSVSDDTWDLTGQMHLWF